MIIMKRVFIVSFVLLAAIATTAYGAGVCANFSPSEISVQQMTADEMFHKAQCFMLGQEGYPQHNGKAAEWFYQAAEKGHVEAQNVIASLLADGIGVVKDEAEAIKWFTIAANNGHARAQSRLGTIYSRGLLGVTKSDVEAEKWYRMAEKNGDLVARKWLLKKENEKKEQEK